jgi:hypothetical protein
MATITLTLKARNKKDGTSPIVIRIRYKGRFFDIPTGESIIESMLKPHTKQQSDPIASTN